MHDALQEAAEAGKGSCVVKAMKKATKPGKASARSFTMYARLLLLISNDGMLLIHLGVASLMKLFFDWHMYMQFKI